MLNDYINRHLWSPGACAAVALLRYEQMDFKVSITQPLEEHGAWAEADYNPL